MALGRGPGERDRPTDDPPPARRASGPARRGGARGDRTRRRRGQGVPHRRGHDAQPGLGEAERPLPPADPRAQGADPARSRRVRRRGRVPIPPPADPRRGVPGDAEGAARRPARAVRRLARRTSPANAWRSTRRSSATTSSRRTATAPSWARWTSGRSRSPGERPNTCTRPRCGPTSALISTRRRRCSTGASNCRTAPCSSGRSSCCRSSFRRWPTSRHRSTSRRARPPSPKRSGIVRRRFGPSWCGSWPGQRSTQPGPWRSPRRRPGGSSRRPNASATWSLRDQAILLLALFAFFQGRTERDGADPRRADGPRTDDVKAGAAGDRRRNSASPPTSARSRSTKRFVVLDRAYELQGDSLSGEGQDLPGPGGSPRDGRALRGGARRDRPSGRRCSMSWAGRTPSSPRTRRPERRFGSRVVWRRRSRCSGRCTRSTKRWAKQASTRRSAG